MDGIRRAALFAIGIWAIEPVSADVWCKPIVIRGDGLDDYVTVPAEFVHVVRPERQDETQDLLARRSVVVESRSEATQLLRRNDALPVTEQYFLVRASAFDVADDYVVQSALTVYFSPSRGEVDVMDAAFGDGGPAKNLALLVGLMGAASTSRQGCQVVL